ncbi:MAG: S8 family serine peptidase, partial [bacterium]
MKSKLLVIIMLTLAVAAVSAAKIDSRIKTSGGEEIKVWVFFEDKGVSRGTEGAVAREYLSERAIARRAEAGISFDERDIPVEASYISRVEAEGGTLIRQSRWLNGASFVIRARHIGRIAELDFVREIRPVARLVRPIPEPRERPFPDGGPDEFYGSTRGQLDMIGATDLHDLGYAGHGVLVGLLDSGFRLTHNAFDSLDLVATYDFLHDDESVDYDSSAGDTDYSGYRHGTQTLGCVAGYLPGIYIGAAYRASVALGKTEDVSSEYVTEEDNWVAGIEWMDSLGADIVTSSLGYSVFDSDTPYTFDDMDGNTALTTIAADIAASKGICVVNSAGNERNDFYWPHIIAPADGDSVLAVAAVDPFKVIAPFSSPGPTADGRIKPDVSATGMWTVLVNTEDTVGINLWGSGTSFSCPLIA